MRDFEQEYKNYINEDIPDLWNRIEPNLKAKETIVNPVHDIESATVEYNNQVNPDPIQTHADVVNLQDAKTKKTRNMNRFFKMAIPVAAAFCLLLIGANVIFLSKKSSDMATSETAREESGSSNMKGDAFHFGGGSAASEAADESATAECDEADYAMADEATTDSDDENESVVTTDETAADEAAEPEAPVDEDTGDQDVKADENKTDQSNGNAIGANTITFAEVTCVKDAASDIEGYESYYIFRTKDDKEIKAYVTYEMMSEWGEADYFVTAGLTYDIQVEKMKNESVNGSKKNAIKSTEAYILKAISEK